MALLSVVRATVRPVTPEERAEACAVLDFPVVSGNVSLYNETDGTGILPTPTIGAVGILASLDEMIAGRLPN
jgi:phosphoribosylformylglycinamidine (FGAM) synthase-like enzyme